MICRNYSRVLYTANSSGRGVVGHSPARLKGYPDANNNAPLERASGYGNTAGTKPAKRGYSGRGTPRAALSILPAKAAGFHGDMEVANGYAPD